MDSSQSIEEGIKILDFLKKKKEESEKSRELQKIILLERRQINRNDPAVAQLQIHFPASFGASADFKDYFNEKVYKFNLDADVHELNEINPLNYIIEIRSVKIMYSWFEYFIKSFTRDYGMEGQGYVIKVKGCWDKFDS